MQKQLVLLAAASVLLAAPSTPTPAQQLVSDLTCRTVLGGQPFRTSQPPRTTTCCYVQPEASWYRAHGVDVFSYYQRRDGENVFTAACDRLLIGSIGDSNRGNGSGGNGGGGNGGNGGQEPGGEEPGGEDGAGNPGNNKPNGNAGESPGPGDYGNGEKGRSQ